MSLSNRISSRYYVISPIEQANNVSPIETLPPLDPFGRYK